MYTPSQLCGAALTVYDDLYTCLCSGACATDCSGANFCTNEAQIASTCATCASSSCSTQLSACESN